MRMMDAVKRSTLERLSLLVFQSIQKQTSKVQFFGFLPPFKGEDNQKTC